MLISLSWRLVKKEHNLLETLQVLQQIVLFSLCEKRAAGILEACRLWDIDNMLRGLYGARLSLLNVALYPWMDFINPC